MSALDQTRSIVAEVLRIPVEELTPERPLGEVATLDSLSLAEIATALAEEFGIRLPSDGLTEVASIQELADLVGRAPKR